MSESTRTVRRISPRGLCGALLLCVLPIGCGKLSPSSPGIDEQPNSLGTGGGAASGGSAAFGGGPTEEERALAAKAARAAKEKGAALEVLSESHFPIPSLPTHFSSCSAVLGAKLFTFVMTNANQRLAVTALPLSPLEQGVVSYEAPVVAGEDASCVISPHGEGVAVASFPDTDELPGTFFLFDAEGKLEGNFEMESSPPSLAQIFSIASDDVDLITVSTAQRATERFEVSLTSLEGEKFSAPQLLIECFNGSLYTQAIAAEAGFDVAVSCNEWNDSNERAPALHLFHYENGEISPKNLTLGGESPTVAELAFPSRRIHRTSQGLWVELPYEWFKEDGPIYSGFNLCPILENGEAPDGSELPEYNLLPDEGSPCLTARLGLFALFDSARIGELLVTDEGWIHVTKKRPPVANFLTPNGEIGSTVLLLDATDESPQRLSCQGDSCTSLSAIGPGSSLLFRTVDQLSSDSPVHGQKRSPLTVKGKIPFDEFLSGYRLEKQLKNERILLQLYLNSEDEAPSLLLLDGDEVTLVAQDAAFQSSNYSESSPIEMSDGYQIFSEAGLYSNTEPYTLSSTFVSKEGEVTTHSLTGALGSAFWPCGDSVYSMKWVGEPGANEVTGGQVTLYEKGGKGFYPLSDFDPEREHGCIQELGLIPVTRGNRSLDLFDLKEGSRRAISLPEGTTTLHGLPHSSAGSRLVLFVRSVWFDAVRLLVLGRDGIEIDKELFLPWELREISEHLTYLAPPEVSSDLSQIYLLWHSKGNGSFLSTWQLKE